MKNDQDSITNFHGEVITVEEAIRRFEISPVVEQFGTWVVTTKGVESLVTPYTIIFERLGEPDWLDHMLEKTWVNKSDFVAAFSFAQELFNKRQTFLKSGRPLKAFLCHAKDDKQAVREFYNKLRVIGIQPWFDEENLLPGQDWQHEIKNAVRDSDVVIVCLSKKSIDKTGFVQKEIKYSLDAADERPEGRIFLIPARLEECSVPDRLSDKQWVDLYSDQGFDRLLQTLRAVLKIDVLFPC